MATDTNRVALVFSINASPAGQYADVTARAMQIGSDGDIGYGYDRAYEALSGFEAHASGNTAHRDEGFRSWGIRVASPSYRTTVDEWEAERIHKVLKSVRVKLDKMVESGFGEPGTFGAYVARCAKALGIKYIAFTAPYARSHWASGDRYMLAGISRWRATHRQYP